MNTAGGIGAGVTGYIGKLFKSKNNTVNPLINSGD